MRDDTGSHSEAPGPPVPLDVVPLHSTNLLTVLSEDGTVLYESPAIERIFGFEQEALVGEPVAEYFHPEDRDRVVEAFGTVVTSDGYTVESVEYRHERADGSYRWVESVASADPTPDGHYVVNTRDVSERRARERELERTNARLQEFAGVVSHDLRNPLNVAKGRLELARAAHDSEDLAAVARAQDRMETLIDDLLALARTGTGVGEVEPVDVGAVCEECWDVVAPGGSTLRVEVDRPVLADRSRLGQLFENVLRNAVEHGGESVRITVGRLDDPPGFYVEDDGWGIDEADRSRVFEGGYSTDEDGTGLGLTIVADVAEAHGWVVDLCEGREGGARFEVTGVEFQ